MSEVLRCGGGVEAAVSIRLSFVEGAKSPNIRSNTPFLRCFNRGEWSRTFGVEHLER
jgi:hypothetical protein